MFSIQMESQSLHLLKKNPYRAPSVLWTHGVKNLAFKSQALVFIFKNDDNRNNYIYI